MRTNVIFLILSLLIISCKENNRKTPNIENAIAEKVNKYCIEKADCIISLNDFTQFKWDKFYVFNYTQSDKVINSSLGFDYKNYQSHTRPWIFTKGDSIIYYENNFSGIEKPMNNQINFDYPDSQYCKIYTPKDSLFKVEIVRIDNNTKIIVLHESK